MWIPIIWGRAFLGKTDEVDGVCVATLASHVMGLPLHSHGSFVVFPSAGRGPARTIALPLQADSQRLAYLRGWGALGLMFVTVSAMSVGSAASSGGGIGVGVGVPLLLGALYLRCFKKTAPDRRGLLRAYGVSTGIPADPARLGSEREGIEAEVRRTLDEQYGHADRDYRDAAGPRSWAAVALDPAVTDLGLVARALTLTRLEASRADRAGRATLDETHAELWRKLRRLDPSIVAAGAVRRASPQLFFIILGCIYLALGPLMLMMMHFVDAREAARPRPAKAVSIMAPTPGGKPALPGETLRPGTRVEVQIWGSWLRAVVTGDTGGRVGIRLDGSGAIWTVARDKISIPPPGAAEPSTAFDAGAATE